MSCLSVVTSGRRHSHLQRRWWGGTFNCCRLYCANFLCWKHCHCFKLMKFHSSLYKAELKKESYALNIELHFSVHSSFISWKPVLMKPQFYCNHIIKFIPWISVTQFTCRSNESECLWYGGANRIWTSVERHVLVQDHVFGMRPLFWASHRSCKFIYCRYTSLLGTAVAQWLRCCATNRKVAGSIPAGVIGISHWHKLLPIALWSWGRPIL